MILQPIERRPAHRFVLGMPGDRAEHVLVGDARQRAQRDRFARRVLGDADERLRVGQRVDRGAAFRFAERLRTLRARCRAASSIACDRTCSSASSFATRGERGRIHQLRDRGAADARRPRPRARSRSAARAPRAESPARRPGGRRRPGSCAAIVCGIDRAVPYALQPDAWSACDRVQAIPSREPEVRSTWRRPSRPCDAGAHLLVDVENAAVRADVERPPRREPARRQHAVRPRHVLRRIAQNRIADAERCRELRVRLRRCRRSPRNSCTFNRRSSSPLDPSDLHSAVQPPVNAFGNHATTTGRPARSFRR